MRGMVLDGGEVKLARNRPDPVLQAGEAMLSPLKTLVSQREVELRAGLFGFSGVPGSAFIATVDAVEAKHDGHFVGRRVVGSPVVYCGDCDLCRAGLSIHCRNREIAGMLGRDGCLADRFVLPARNLIEVPDSVDDDRAAFAEPLAAALQAARQLTIVGKPYITVLGDGLVGLLAVQVMAKLNASVRLIGRVSEKLALCEKWGIKHRHVDDIGRRADQDIVVECSGSPGGLAVAMQLVRPRGTIVLQSLCAEETMRGARKNIGLPLLVRNEISIIGSFSGPLGEALGMIARGEVDVISMISRRMKLDDGAAIFDVAARPEMIAVLVDS